MAGSQIGQEHWGKKGQMADKRGDGRVQARWQFLWVVVQDGDDREPDGAGEVGQGGPDGQGGRGWQGAGGPDGSFCGWWGRRGWQGARWGRGSRGKEGQMAGEGGDDKVQEGQMAVAGVVGW